jgi:hypothetical protein
MPRIRYTLRVNDDQFHEEDYFPPMDLAQIESFLLTSILAPLKKIRAERGEPTIDLIGFVITNPHVHAHDWKKLRNDAYAGKAHHICNRCGITGYRYFHLVTGEAKNSSMTRNEDWKSPKYELCHDPLRKMPPAKSLRFK